MNLARAWLLILYAALSMSAQAEMAPTEEKSFPVGPISAKLRDAGASAAAVRRFEIEWQSQWPEDQKELSDYIYRLAPRDLQNYIQELSQSTADDQYVRGSDFSMRPDTPRGTILHIVLDHSLVFPGTQHDIRVYVPAQYIGDHPAAVHLQLDGLIFGMSTLFDNLIQDHGLPPLVAIGIKPGVVVAANATNSKRYNRSLEFDGLTDDLERFILGEVFPAVEQLHTQTGLPIRLSRDPNDHSVAGVSTGGIGSFTLAWQHPEVFRRVYTGIGTFVGMRGGDRYPVLVRKTEPKPIRIYLQDGSRDELDDSIGEVGDWRLGNQTMLSALEFAGYQVEHVWGEGNHNENHFVALFPDAMRWLWKGWPAPVVAGTSRNNLLKAIVDTGTAWEPASAAEEQSIIFTGTDRGYESLAPGGRKYFTDTQTGRIYLKRNRAKPVLVAAGLQSPTGIAVSPDGAWLAVVERRTHWGFSYRIELNGQLSAPQRFFWFHVPDSADDSGAGGCVMDREGRLYATSHLGVQVFDHNGRVRAILPVPGGAVSSIAFGGIGSTILYVRTRDGHVVRRAMRVPGADLVASPMPVPDWDAG
jgi:gluconolactonase